MISGMKHFCGEILRELGFFTLEKTRLWQGEVIVAFQYLRGAYEKDDKRLFTKHIVAGQRGMAPN